MEASWKSTTDENIGAVTWSNNWVKSGPQTGITVSNHKAILTLHICIQTVDENDDIY